MEDSPSAPDADPLDRVSLRYRMLKVIDRIERELAASGPEGIGPGRPSWRSLFFNDEDGASLRVLVCPRGAARAAWAASLVSGFLEETERIPSLAWFCLDEDPVEMARRLLCLSAGLGPAEHLAGGRSWSRRELHRMSQSAGRLAEHPVMLECPSPLPVPVRVLRERCAQWQDRLGFCRPVLIDGLESLCTSDGRAWGADPSASGEIAAELLALARWLGAPVLVLASGASGTEERRRFLAPFWDTADLIGFLETDEADPRTGVAAAELYFVKRRGAGGEDQRDLLPLVYWPKRGLFEEADSG
jgi:hypothetical protein